MKPRKLTVSAFGPYAGQVEVDFARLGERGLYLITAEALPVQAREVHPQQQLLLFPPKPNPPPHPQQDRMRKSHRMSHPHPQPSLFPLKPFPLPQQQSNKSGNRQLPKPPSHPPSHTARYILFKALRSYFQVLFFPYVSFTRLSLAIRAVRLFGILLPAFFDIWSSANVASRFYMSRFFAGEGQML